MKTVKFISLLLLSTLFFQCSKDETGIKGSLSLALGSGTSSQTALKLNDINSLLISVKDLENDEMILSSEEISLIFSENSVTSEPILLTEGNYELTDFMVLDDNANVIYAAPKTGSLFENFVTSALPIPFSVLGDQIINLTIEVIDTKSGNPEDLGYSALSFQTVPSSDILISVFGFNETEDNLIFIPSQVSLYINEDSIYSTTLESKINSFKVPLSDDDYTLKFSSFEKEVTIIIPNAELDNYSSIPLDVVIGNVEIESPVGTYPLNGDALDISGNEFNGSVTGATGVENRFDIESRALFFDGIDDKVIFPTDFDLENRTINIWINVNSFVPNDHNLNVTNVIYASDHSTLEYGSTGLSVRQEEEKYLLQFTVGGTSEGTYLHEINLDEWFMATLTAGDFESKYYINGQLVQTVTRFNNFSKDGMSNAALGLSRKEDRFFNGVLDNLSVYDKALSEEEIKTLFINN